jgi:predicted dithiol-disulfide oxidoreductase (DUF899 family)
MNIQAKVEIQAEMRDLYQSINTAQKRLNDLKRAASLGEVPDYGLLGPDGQQVTLSSLFGDNDDLIVIQNMGRSCPYCTLWADSFMGALPHIESRAAFAVVSPDSPEEQAEFKRSRGWSFTMFSSQGSKFKQDLGFETKQGEQMPGVSTFHRNGDQIINVANDSFGPGDNYCGVWHLFELLDNGTAAWAPKFSY